MGLWIVQRFQFVTLLKQPIAPYLPTGRLTVLSPTEPVMIVLKLSFFIGLVLASPVLLYQIWGFMSPALYEKERKAFVPALLVGTLLFIVGATLGYVFVVPQALRVLFSFQSAALQPMITYDAYFGFVLQILVGLGLSFEIPLVITILAAFGLVTPAALQPLPAARGGPGVRGGRPAVARDGCALDVHDDRPDPPALRGGLRRRGPDAPAAAPPRRRGGGRGDGGPAALGGPGRRPGARPAAQASRDGHRGRTAQRFRRPGPGRQGSGPGHGRRAEAWGFPRRRSIPSRIPTR